MTVPDEPFVVTSERWRFEPHVTLLPIGSRVQFHNADPGSIHVHTFAQKNGEFHRTLGAGTSSVDYALKSPEAVFVKDDIHPWTSATLFATDTPFAARTDAEGKFAIAGLPPGEYTVTVWHELLGTARESARIVVDQSTALDFVLRPRKGRLDGRRRVDGTR
ncbi:MAG: carboxypeptidase regulatory-like domain-containing protein [Planctomycetes bacterium]|nr:carboxypeptidase regulatory-like domain-containing protein [Planctomycetota bacterium]